MQLMSGGTQRPDRLHVQPAVGQTPQLPPAPLGPHSRPVQLPVMTDTQRPAAHIWPETQKFPQAPQLFRSVCSDVH